MTTFFHSRRRWGQTLRQGFTLVELLVVMAIMAVLASIGLFAYQPFQNRSAVNNGAVLLQSWLTAAKQRALRDQLPRGLRLLPGDEILDNAGSPIANLVTKCVYLEQQDDIVGTSISNAGAGTSAFTVSPNPGTLINGDYLEINGGLVHQINGTASSGATVAVTNPFPFAIPANSGATFRIYRRPQVASATEEILKLPKGAVINLASNGTYGNALSSASPPLDILFAPNGALLSPAPHDDKIILWVSGTQKDPSGNVKPNQGQPSLVVVYVRSGLVAAYEANMGSADGGVTLVNPYTKVQ